MARHGLSVLYRADPARSHSKLLPLPGIFLATVAVVVSTRLSHSHSRVSRDSNRTLSHSHSPREMQPHVRTWRLTSPVCTATSHTRSLSHTVGHSLVPHKYTHPRGHSPAVSHTHVGVHTHVPLLARTWFPPAAVPLLHMACRESRTPAHSRPHHSHTGAHPHSGAHPYTGTHSGSHTGSHSHSRLLAHNASHPCYACVAARI